MFTTTPSVGSSSFLQKSQDTAIAIFNAAAIQRTVLIPALLLLIQPPMIPLTSKNQTLITILSLFGFFVLNARASLAMSQYTLVSTVVGISLNLRLYLQQIDLPTGTQGIPMEPLQ